MCHVTSKTLINPSLDRSYKDSILEIFNWVKLTLNVCIEGEKHIW